MNISAELSLYPLDANYASDIRDFIAALQQVQGLEVRAHALSTEVFGDYELVMQTISTLTRTVFERDPSAVLVAKYLNRDRR